MVEDDRNNAPEDLHSLIDRHPVKVTPETLVTDAIELIDRSVSRQRNCVLVVEAEILVGILTERDFVRLLAKEVEIKGLTVEEVMTRQLISLTLTEDCQIAEAMQLMRRHEIQNLPIIDDLGQLIGIISAADLQETLKPANFVKLRSIEEIKLDRPILVSPTESLLNLCRQTIDKGSNCAIVVERQEENRLLPVGIVTERDILQARASQLDLALTNAAEIVKSPPTCIDLKTTLWEVYRDMEKNVGDRAIVIRDDGEIVGIVTKYNLIQALQESDSDNIIALKQKILDRQKQEIKRVNERLQQKNSEIELLKQGFDLEKKQLQTVIRSIKDIILQIEVREDTSLEIQIVSSASNTTQIASIDRTVEELQRESSQNKLQLPILKALYTQKPIDFEYGFHIDRIQYWFLASITPTSEKTVIWLARDISPRKRAEEQLAKNEEYLRTLINNISGATYRYSYQIDSTIEFMSESIEKITGYPASDYIDYNKRSLVDIIHFQDREKTQRYIHQAISQQTPYELEYRIVDARGKIRWVCERGKGLFSPEGKLIYRDGVIFDITEHKQVDKELEYRLTFEQMISTLSNYFINLTVGKLDRGIEYALKRVCKFFDFDRGFIFLASERGFSKIYSWLASDVKLKELQLPKLLTEEATDSLWWGKEVTRLKTIVIPNVDRLSEIEKAQLLDPNISSLIVLPIVSQGLLLGAVKFHCLKKKELRFRDSLMLLKLFTQILVSVIERKNAEEERQKIERELFQEKELAQVMLHSIGDAVIGTDDRGRITYFNPVAEQLTGWQYDRVKGKLLSEVFQTIDEETKQPLENPIDRVLREGCSVDMEGGAILVDRQGKEYAIDNSAAPMRDRKGQLIGAVLVFHDVSESRNLSRQLSWQASHDSLTGLFNRRKFEQEAIEALASAKHERQEHALCYIDLDQFKVVNDTCGHAAGDELLHQVTHLLKQRVRNTDILARLGGDEFGLLLYQCSLTRAQQIAETIRQLIHDFRFAWEGKTFAIGCSIGIVGIDTDSQDLNSLLGAADAACYAAKANGRNCIHTYRPDDLELAQQRSERRWIAYINQALENNYFRLYHQKIVPLDPSSLEIHYEILLRLLDDRGKLVSPMAFIPAAERYDLMPAIDRWVINTFLTDYECHLEEGDSEPFAVYTINLSGASVNNPQFNNFLIEQIERTKVPPQKICFEITETTAISNLERAAKLIQSLKEIGCRFALDDFGSGVSSLVYLKNLPVDYLKIDGSFVRNIVSDPIDRIMVESVNQISHVMGIETIAEYVENDAIFQKLQDIGVDYAQGYSIGKPIPLPFSAVVSRQNLGTLEHP